MPPHSSSFPARSWSQTAPTLTLLRRRHGSRLLLLCINSIPLLLLQRSDRRNTRRRHNPRNAMCAPFRAPVRRRGMRMRVVAARCGQPCGLAAWPEPLACLPRIRRNVSRYRISWPSTTNHATNHPSTPKVRRQGERSIRPPPSVV